MDSLPLIELKKYGSVGQITFDRPEKYNSMIRTMALSIQSALDTLNLDEEVRCIVITGKGKAFCAGQDLKEPMENPNLDISRIIGEHFNPIILRMCKIEKPVVVAVNGVAAGAGMSIALAGDLTVACESASFTMAFSRIGLIPDSGGTYFLPRLVGRQRALGLMMLSDKITAREAESMGVIYKAVPDGEFQDYVKDLAVKLASMPTKALGLTKRAVNESWNNKLEDQLNLEDELQSIAAKTEDFEEGIKAFLEKRNPRFKGV